MHDTSLAKQATLVTALQNPAIFDHPVQTVEIMETHISWVVLAGDYAYKLKKAVDFGFLDYSSLDKRRLQCDAELRLNRRTAADIYLEVIPVGGTHQAPRLNQEPAIEYLVKMRRFDQAALMSRRLQSAVLQPGHFIQLGHRLAAFHHHIDTAGADTHYGTPEVAYHPVAENFRQIAERIDDPTLRQRLGHIEQWAEGFFDQHRPVFEARKAGGFIRDCHGDLHLNNIVLINEQPVFFDCIEFNPRLRIIDVMSELAFLLMDLEEHGHRQEAALVCNSYLEQTGDYAGIALLRFYQCYRAMVRAKVAVLGLDTGQSDAQARARIMRGFEGYLGLAERYTETMRPRLLITHGLSGSGKTTLSTPLLGPLNAIRLRSDIERKRLFGLATDADSRSAIKGGIYTAEASRRTYQRLGELSQQILRTGFSVLVDATFLKREDRDHFHQLAQQVGVPLQILTFEAEPAVLRERVSQRAAQGGDASEATLEVLEQQLAGFRPLQTDELVCCIRIDSTRPPDPAALLASIRG